jgi:hypothetical protein
MARLAMVFQYCARGNFLSPFSVASTGFRLLFDVFIHALFLRTNAPQMFSSRHLVLLAAVKGNQDAKWSLLALPGVGGKVKIVSVALRLWRGAFPGHPLSQVAFQIRILRVRRQIAELLRIGGLVV